jgi:hypothetical protein
MDSSSFDTVEPSWHSVGPVAAQVCTERVSTARTRETQRVTPSVERQVSRVSGRDKLGHRLGAGARVVGAVSRHLTIRRGDRHARRANGRGALLAMTKKRDERDHANGQEHLTNARAREGAEEAALSLPCEEDLPLCSPSCHGIAYCTKSFIWMSGIKIAKAMKPTAPPITTIMSGSRRLVSACTRVSTCVSYALATFSSIASS